MGRVEVVTARATHIGPVATRLRNIDRIECEAMGHSPKQALRNGFLLSDRCWTALVDGRPEAMFGAVTVSALDRRKTVWFLGTDEVYRHGRLLLAWGPGLIRRAVDSRWWAGNLVSSANGKAIRLLEAWGFTVEPEEQMVNGVPFRHFWMIRDV
ncbi:hypothetical protein [Sphingobium indicum]|uniref:N-acetyltransferase domain-containing protein n=1 Tax=Sphingobium indicum (strain DSM 16412 / CCM 7286 / MTCC 6364 / B90A) TaxID=861109 RepID=A0A1L5BMG6_SPHIB|nr:hypothetical protein [Sphingobium indicum]APL94085.1 hypothetical protein SIDU_05965 [Sphingobium indicum B90A]